MSETKLNSGSGVLRMTVEITRKATGKKETYELVGDATPEDAEAVARQLNLPLQQEKPPPDQ